MYANALAETLTLMVGGYTLILFSKQLSLVSLLRLVVLTVDMCHQGVYSSCGCIKSIISTLQEL